MILKKKNTAKRNMSSMYRIKIWLETPEIKFLSVALLSQAKKSECETAQPSLNYRMAAPDVL